MERWWSHGLSGEDRDEWCAALDSGVISEDLMITSPTSNADGWSSPTRPQPSMAPELQAFIAEECSKRLR